MSKKTTAPGSIDPAALYTLTEFKRAAGIGDNTIAKAKAAGIVLKRHYVGRRGFVQGQDGIDFLLTCAAKLKPGYAFAQS